MSKDFSNLLGGAIANKQVGELNIRDRIIIREDLKALIPPLTSDELIQLEENILKEGVRDPLIIWPVGEAFVLVDGHNRFSICQRLGLEFPFRKIEFKDEEEVRDWMIKNQLGRRNLTTEQQSYLRGLRYNREKSQGKRTDLTLDQSDLKLNSESTASTLAKEYNVSEATIKRDGEFAAGLESLSKENPDLKKEILEGKSELSKQEIRNAAKNKNKGSKTKGYTKKSVSADEIADIALAYLKNEQRSMSEVCALISLDLTSASSKEFFLKWNDNLNQNKS